MPLINVVREVCAVVGVVIPNSIFAGISSNRTHQELLSCANEMAQRIAYDNRDWTVLRKTAVHTNTFLIWQNGAPYAVGDQVTDPNDGSSWRCMSAHESAASGTFADDRAARPTYWIGATEIGFVLPADFKRMLLTANVRSSTQPKQPLTFIPDYDQWTERRLSNTNDGWGEWTIAAERLWVAPPPRGFVPAPADPPVRITYPYIDRNPVKLHAGGVGAVFVDDLDTFRLDERLLKLGMIAQWKAQKGAPYSEDYATFGDALLMAMGKDSPSPTLIHRSPVSSFDNVRVAYPWPVPTP